MSLHSQSKNRPDLSRGGFLIDSGTYRFSYIICKLIITKIETDLKIKISREKLEAYIDEKNWQRFSYLFWESSQ